MDGTMFQLRSFVHQRLYTAAEEILGEVEKTITLTLALYKAEVSPPKVKIESPQHEADPRLKKSAEEPLLTCSPVEHGDRCDAAPLQESPGQSPPGESMRVCRSTEVLGPPRTSRDINQNILNSCLVQVGEASLQGFLLESLPSRDPPTAHHPESASLKMPKRIKRKRTAGPYPHGHPLDPLEHGPTLNPRTTVISAQLTPPTNDTDVSTTSHTAVVTHSSSSTQHDPTASLTPSTPKVFKEICSILPLSSGGKKKRCRITVEELARRVGPPEYMSFSSLVAYLRSDNNARKELQVQLEEAGIKPSELTTEMSLFSRLCEEEVDALCESLAGLVQDHLPFQGLHIIPEAEDELVTVGRLLEFRSHLRKAIADIKGRVEAVDLASHGFMSKMLDIILSIFERCLDNQMNSRPIY